MKTKVKSASSAVIVLNPVSSVPTGKHLCVRSNRVGQTILPFFNHTKRPEGVSGITQGKKGHLRIVGVGLSRWFRKGDVIEIAA